MEHAAGNRSHSSIDTYAPVLDHKDPNPALLVSSLGQDPRLVLATQGPGLLAQGTSSAMVPMKATPTYRISESKQLGIFRPGQAMNSPYAHQGSSAMPSPSPMQGTFMPSQLGLTPFPKFVNVPSGVWIRDGDSSLESPSLTPDGTDMYQDPMESHNAVNFNNINPFRFVGQQQTFNTGLIDTRRMSVSTNSMSSAGVREEYSLSDSSYASDVDWSATEQQSQHMFSPVVSPQLQQPEMTRSVQPYRTSPNASSARASPYTTSTDRTKRWSTGAYGPMGNPQRPSGFLAHRFSYQSPAQMSKPFSHNPHADLQPINFPPPQPSPSFGPHDHGINSPLFSQPVYSSIQQFFPEPIRPLPSQGRFPFASTLEGFRHRAAHLSDYSDPPNLYASLTEEPCDPPESDMNPEDPDMIPHQQDLRFPGDLYTPKWVRGHGNKREGWCGLCKPGRWLVLKNSAFWYDKSFTHGVSAASGAAFQGPQETRRTDGNPDVWEGHCGNCGDWVALVSSKKKGTTWFRHAYKCHTHTKVKEGPKRRRNTECTPRVPSPKSPQLATIEAETTTAAKTEPAEVTTVKRASLPANFSSTPRIVELPECEDACCPSTTGSTETIVKVEQQPSTEQSTEAATIASVPVSAATEAFPSLPSASMADHLGMTAFYQHDHGSHAIEAYNLLPSEEYQNSQLGFAGDYDYMHGNGMHNLDSGLGLIFDGRPFGQSEMMMPCSGAFY